MANRSGADDESGAVTPVPAPVLADVDLLARVGARDPEALEALYARYGRVCYSLARRVLRDATLAQDVLQEVFLAVWRDPGRYDGRRGVFSTWLLSMTHHKAVDLVRREENLRKRHAAAGAEHAAGPPAPAPEDEAWGAMRRDRVREALGQLPEPQRRALGLAYYGGYTQSEIAGLTKAPLGTVKTRMLAGMRTLRRVLEIPLDEGRIS